LPEFIRYVGPILEQPAWIGRRIAAAPSADERPLVLVSLSTTYQGQDTTLAAIIDALAKMPVRAVVTLGKALEGRQMAAPANVEIVVGASHDDILAQASAVVTHAGHGTTLRALRAGVPIVAIPMGRDQNDNAARVEYHGAGVRIEPSAPSEEIAEALRRVISEPNFTANARKLARAIASEDGGAQRFVDEIEALARARDAAGSSPRQAVHRVA
jgi:MGT family glycosyltransferase